jgi:hypothetical protein
MFVDPAPKFLCRPISVGNARWKPAAVRTASRFPRASVRFNEYFAQRTTWLPRIIIGARCLCIQP